MIENGLPAVQGLRGVGKCSFLSALPAAIKHYRQVAPQLAGGATIVRREWARDILREAFKTIGPDCAMRARILRSVIAAAPEHAAELTELAVALGPNCAETFGGGGAQTQAGDEGFGPPPSIYNVRNPPGLSHRRRGGQGTWLPSATTAAPSSFRRRARKRTQTSAIRSAPAR